MARKLMGIIAFLLLTLATLPVDAGRGGGRDTKVRSGGTSVSQVSRSSGRSYRSARTSRTGRVQAHRGANRGGRAHVNRGGHRGYRHYYPGYFGYSYGLGWWGPHLSLYAGYPFGFYNYGYGPYGYYHTGYYGYYRDDLGTVKVKSTVKNASLYLNGHYLGKARKFDGWPQSLHLRQGRYELILFHDGMETVRREIEVVPRTTQKLNITMTPGETTPVKELSKPIINRNKERRELYQRYSKDRPERRKDQERRTPRTVRGGAESTAQTLDFRREPGYLVLSIAQSDAVIYLDGRFVSTAGELAKRGGKIKVDVGRHQLEIFMSGQKPHTREIDIKAGDRLALDIDLAKKK